tara:strand:+ start:1709 stop:2200 length:492 start_codon:yes stop_codon:yes gene_type:complete
MIWVDVFIVAILGISSMLGAWRGMVRELLSLSFLVLAVVIAQSYGTVVSEMLVSVVANGTVRYFVAVCCLFVAVLIFGALVIFISQKFLILTGLMLIDRGLGVVFGLVRGALIVLILTFVARPFVNGSDMWATSIFLPYVDSLSQLLFFQYAEAFDFSRPEII